MSIPQTLNILQQPNGWEENEMYRHGLREKA
jgi:hypothetical protein